MKKITESEFNLMGWDDKWHRNQPNRTVSKMETVAGHVEVLPDFEDALESAFWDFDARHKAKDGPSERDAFKQVLMGLFSAGIDPESRGIRAELLARRMEVESQSKIIEALRTQPQASVVDVPSVDWIEKGLIEMGHVGPSVRLTAEHVHAILQSNPRSVMRVKANPSWFMWTFVAGVVFGWMVAWISWIEPLIKGVK